MADFPTNVPSNGSLFIAANNAATTLNGGVTDIATSFTCASTTLFPSSGKISIESEIAYFGANNTATSVLSSITRGQESTSNVAHSSGIAVNMYRTAAHHNNTKDEVISIAQNIKDRFGLGSTSIVIPSGVTFARDSQPGFIASKNVSQDNSTGDGTLVTVTFGNEIIDKTSNFDGTTFTAPVTGLYLITTLVELSGILAAHTSGDIQIVTSNRTLSNYYDDILGTTAGYADLIHSTLVDMDANDTAIINVRVAGSTKVVDVPSNGYTVFTVALIV